MRDLNDLCYFAAAIDHGGFSAASRALGLPKSTLSRRIAALEERLAVRLLHRSTRRLVVTEVGRQFHAHWQAILVEADAADAVAASTHVEPCGRLHVSCPVALLHWQVAEMLSEFAARHPQVELQISALNRAVDPIAENVDVALRVRPLPLSDSNLVMRRLGESAQCLVASPALIAQRGYPHHPTDLANWPSLGNGTPVAERAMTIEHRPRLVTSDMHTLRQAALTGLGVVQLPRAFVQQDLLNGRLLMLLPNWQAPPQLIHAVFVSRRGLLSSVRALLGHLADGFSVLKP